VGLPRSLTLEWGSGVRKFCSNWRCSLKFVCHHCYCVSPTVMLCPAVSLHLHNTKLGASLKNLWCAPEFVPSTSNPCRRLCFFVHYWAVLRTPWEQTTSLVVLSLASIRKFASNTSAISIIMISQQQCHLLIGSTAVMTHTTVCRDYSCKQASKGMQHNKDCIK